MSDKKLFIAVVVFIGALLIFGGALLYQREVRHKELLLDWEESGFNFSGKIEDIRLVTINAQGCGCSDSTAKPGVYVAIELDRPVELRYRRQKEQKRLTTDLLLVCTYQRRQDISLGDSNAWVALLRAKESQEEISFTGYANKVCFDPKREELFVSRLSVVEK